MQLLHNGLTIIGANAKLYAALGHAHLQHREAGIDFSERPLDAAEDCVRKVVALEPASASALQLRGWIHYGCDRIQQAVADRQAALAAGPNNPDTLLLLTNCYLISGKAAAARPLIPRVLTVDPLTPLSRCLPAFADAMEGNLVEKIVVHAAEMRAGGGFGAGIGITLERVNVGDVSDHGIHLEDDVIALEESLQGVRRGGRNARVLRVFRMVRHPPRSDSTA